MGQVAETRNASAKLPERTLWHRLDGPVTLVASTLSLLVALAGLQSQMRSVQAFMHQVALDLTTPHIDRTLWILAIFGVVMAWLKPSPGSPATAPMEKGLLDKVRDRLDIAGFAATMGFVVFLGLGFNGMGELPAPWSVVAGFCMTPFVGSKVAVLGMIRRTCAIGFIVLGAYGATSSSSNLLLSPHITQAVIGAVVGAIVAWVVQTRVPSRIRPIA